MTRADLHQRARALITKLEEHECTGGCNCLIVYRAEIMLLLREALGAA